MRVSGCRSREDRVSVRRVTSVVMYNICDSKFKFNVTLTSILGASCAKMYSVQLARHAVVILTRPAARAVVILELVELGQAEHT